MHNFIARSTVFAAVLVCACAVADDTVVESATQTSSASLALAQASPLDRADLESWLDGYMPYALQRGDVAGAVVVVVKDGQILLEKGYGYSDVAERKPVDPQRTLFRPGSVSKLFTWTAVMQQVEQGKLDLDRDVNEYLDFKIPDAYGQPVTLRNALTHTGGFEETVKGALATDPSSSTPLGEYLKAWTPKRIHPPGAVPAYSNYATSLAGYIVERVSGEPYADYIERHILAPLGMEHSSFHQPLPADLQSAVTRGYVTASAPPRPYEIYVTAPAGNLTATGSDMARFMIAHLQKGTYGSAQILRPEIAQLMHDTPLTLLPSVNRMLLGFYENNRNGQRIIGHGGDTMLFHSGLYLFIDHGVGLFLSLNSSGTDLSAYAIRTGLFEGFTDRYFPGATPDGKVDAATAAEHAAMMVGLYTSSRRHDSDFLSLTNLMGPTSVTANEDGTISVSDLTGINAQPQRWREIAPLVWRDVAGKDLLAAKVEGGKVVMFSAGELSPFMTSQPYEWWNSPAWLSPAFTVALAALLLTVVMWPVAAIARRYYGVSFALSGNDARSYRGVRLAAIAVFLIFIAWAGTLSVMTSSGTPLTSKADWWFWLLNVIGLIVFVGSVLVAAWNVRLVWSGSRGWFARFWSIVLALACITMLWTAWVCRLISFNVNY
jgi:CubicO group peptidase (beta-lactamase class C family)